MSDYFVLLERELTRAAGRAGGRRHRGRRAGLLAAAVLIGAGVPAAAVTGVFRDDPAREVNRVFHEPPVAEGTTPNGARWQLLAYERDGRFCFGIALPTGDPDELQPGGGAGCDEHPPGTLTVSAASSVPGRFSKGRPRHSLVYGTAPDAAVSVRLRADGGSVTVRTVDDRKGIAGRFYAVGVPLRWQRQRRHAEALDARGEVIARAGG